LWLTRIVERRYFPRPTEPRIGIGT
jgi:hypothetical protein